MNSRHGSDGRYDRQAPTSQWHDQGPGSDGFGAPRDHAMPVHPNAGPDAGTGYRTNTPLQPGQAWGYAHPHAPVPPAGHYGHPAVPVDRQQPHWAVYGHPMQPPMPYGYPQPAHLMGHGAYQQPSTDAPQPYHQGSHPHHHAAPPSMSQPQFESRAAEHERIDPRTEAAIDEIRASLREFREALREFADRRDNSRDYGT